MNMFVTSENLTKGAVLLTRWLHVQGLSQRDVERRYRVPQHRLSRWVYGHNVPSLVYARIVEGVTDGAVPTDAWLKPATPAQRRAHEKRMAEIAIARISGPRRPKSFRLAVKGG